MIPRRGRRLEVGWLVALCLFAAARNAEACQCEPRDPGFLVTSVAWFPADALGVPFSFYADPRFDPKDRVRPGKRNRVRVYWMDGDALHKVDFRLVPIEEPADLRPERPFPFDRFLVVPERWKAGERYLFLADNVENPAVEVRVVQDRAADVATAQKGAAHLFVDAPDRGELTSLTLAGSCSSHFRAVSVHVRMSLPDEMDYRGSAFFYYTRVDGRAWHPARELCDMIPTGRSWAGTGEERIYERCGPPSDPQAWGANASPEEPGVTAGDHAIEMIGWLPGTTVRFRASGYAHLDCP
jgi:hypothetical protein